jgi:hypothetical protein
MFLRKALRADPTTLQPKRRWARYKLPVPVGLTVHVRDHDPVEGLGTVISEGGVCMFAAAELALESEVEMVFSHSYFAVPPRVRGSVRNRSTYLYGIGFVMETAPERIEVVRLCELFSTMGMLCS